MNNKNTFLKICLVSSRGGHLFQLYQLKPWWGKYQRFWVTFKGEDTKHFLKNEKVYLGYSPESRNLLNAFKNLLLALKILVKEKPDILVSTGAGIAPPFFLVGKLLKVKLIFIEPYDFIQYPSLSGRLVHRFVDKFIVQGNKQKKIFPNADYWGTTI